MKLIKTKHNFFRDLFRINREYEADIVGDFDLKHFKMQFYRSKRFETNFKDGKIELEYYSELDRAKIIQSFNLNVEITNNKILVRVYEPKFILIFLVIQDLAVIIGLIISKESLLFAAYIVPVFLFLQFIVIKLWAFSSLKSCIQYIEVFTKKSLSS